MSIKSDPTRTQWLSQLSGPDPGAGQHLFASLYDELRRLARSHMRREAAGHTLSATALTHEAWFRMAEQNRTQWRSRSHFLAICSTMMRRILVTHEQARRADKRAAELTSLSLRGLDDLAPAPDRDLVAVVGVDGHVRGSTSARCRSRRPCAPRRRGWPSSSARRGG